MSEEIQLGVGSKVMHTEFGQGVVVEAHINTYTVWFKQRGDKEIPHADGRMQVLHAEEAASNRLSVSEVESIFGNLLEKWGGMSEIVELGQRWENGTMILKPANETLQSKEIPIETFFHKIVMTRDRLRVMEQRVNKSGLTDEEKVNLQQYITRIYGSLTTFNVLFANKEDHFRSK